MPPPKGYVLDNPKLPAGYVLDGADAGVAGAGPLGLPQPQNPTVNMKPVPLSGLDSAAMEFGKGALKGAGHTLNNLGHLAVPDWALNAAGVKHQTAQQEDANFAPSNTSQSVGRGIEQAAEFMIPGAGEESALAKLSPYVGKAAPVLKAGLAALGSGVVNKTQGGSFTTGAVAGGVGSGITQGLAAVAPSIAESALKVLAPQRMHGRTVGRAILDDTIGVAPGTVRDSAQKSIQNYTDQLHTAAGASTQPFSLAPARLTLQDAIDNSAMQNSPTALRDLNAAKNQLAYRVHPDTARFDTNAPIPSNVTPMEGLQLKRGLSDLVGNWDKSGGSPASGPIKQTYGALDSELDRTVPGADQFNQKISSLMPVVTRADMAANAAPSTQQMLHRLAVPTGAMAAPLGMGAYGYEKGGVGGAAKGFAEGMAIPLLAASPTGQMALARGLNSAALRRLMPGLVGAGLQFDRSGKSNPDQ